MIAEGDLVAIHGRSRGWVESTQVVVDIYRIEGGRFAKHWDVLQDEAPAVPGGISMFDPNEAGARDD